MFYLSANLWILTNGQKIIFHLKKNSIKLVEKNLLLLPKQLILFFILIIEKL